MCGIVGILNLEAKPPPDEGALRSMLGAIRHRGPDQFGIYLGDGVGLGNARLSIIDLGGGQQPITNEDQTLWIVFNGEIFNYVELRAELEARGHRLATHCDTEVILHLYEDYGPECLAKLNGQWAIAIWDERNRSLFLSRDRLGVRPLFYAQTQGRLIFGSEIKSIFAVPEVSRELDPAGVDQVFTFWSAQAPRTCFKGIQELPPGCFLVANEQGVRVQRYWEPDFGERRGERGEGGKPEPLSSLFGLPSPGADAAVVESFHALLTDAVRIRLRADVPVGAYLSGGLDSSTIAAIVRELGVSHLDTFSIAFSDPQFDESEHQQRMAKFLGTDHQVVYATHEEIGQVFPEVVWHAETALMRTAPAPMYLLSKLVRQRNYKVVLTGEGADEFLGGYDIFKESKVRRFWAQQPDSAWRWRLLQRLYPDIQGLGSAGATYLKSFFGAGLVDTEDPGYSHAIRWKNTARCRRFFNPDLLSALSCPNAELRAPSSELRLSSGPSPLPALRSLESGGGSSLPSSFPTWGPLEQAQYLEVSTFLSTYLLSSQGDRMGMANSVEGRFPFLDYRVVEFCAKLPSRMKLRVLRDKHILREAAGKLVPAEIFNRPKRPYRAPIQKSFFNPACRDWVSECLSEDAVRHAGLFQADAVRQLVRKAEQGGRLGETDSMALVGVVSGQLLYRCFVADYRQSEPVGGQDDVKVIRRSGLGGRAVSGANRPQKGLTAHRMG